MMAAQTPLQIDLRVLAAMLLSLSISAFISVRGGEFGIKFVVM